MNFSPLFYYLVPLRIKYSLKFFCNINKVPDLVTSSYFYIVKMVFYSQERHSFLNQTIKCV